MDRPSPAIVEAARAARTEAVWARRADVRTLAVTGPDRARYLQGQLTQDVLSLAPGQGAMAVKATAKGRTEAYLRVRASGAALLLDLRAPVADAVRTALERYVIMDDCEIREVSSTREVLTVIGPAARAWLAAAGLVVPPLPAHAWVEVDGVAAIEDRSFGVPGLELHAPAARLAALIAALSDRVPSAREAPAEALHVLRVEEGVPVEGAELDLETLPMEAHLMHAVSLQKGCYTGQEVIARVTNLGGVQWSLVGLDGDAEGAPAVGAELFADGEARAVGRVSSVAWSARDARWIALGFVRKAQQAPGTRLTCGAQTLTVRELPSRS